jgi:hypothetical protein
VEHNSSSGTHQQLSAQGPLVTLTASLFAASAKPRPRSTSSHLLRRQKTEPVSKRLFAVLVSDTITAGGGLQVQQGSLPGTHMNTSPPTMLPRVTGIRF